MPTYHVISTNEPAQRVRVIPVDGDFLFTRSISAPFDVIFGVPAGAPGTRAAWVVPVEKGISEYRYGCTSALRHYWDPIELVKEAERVAREYSTATTP